jgi:hypothetical protein
VTQPARIYFYCGGERICALCDEPLEGLRADARAHPGCAREARRRRVREERDPALFPPGELPSEGGTVRQTAIHISRPGYPCPDCGNEEFLMRFVGRVVVGRDAVGDPIEIGPRKMLRCERCGWYGTAKTARDAA